MPQLKISDVKEQVEKLESDVNQKFANLIGEIKRILDNANISTDPNVKANENVDVSKLEEKIEEIRSDLVGHVQVYNNHILQQHGNK